jgi:hypothetical protein
MILIATLLYAVLCKFTVWSITEQNPTVPTIMVGYERKTYNVHIIVSSAVFGLVLWGVKSALNL